MKPVSREIHILLVDSNFHDAIQLCCTFLHTCKFLNLQIHKIIEHKTLKTYSIEEACFWTLCQTMATELNFNFLWN